MEGELPESAQAGQLIDAEATVVYASSEENIDTTIVNGEIIYHKGVFKGGLTEAELVWEIAVEVEKMRACCPAMV